MTRYNYNPYRDITQVVCDDQYLLAYNGLEYFLDEQNNTLNIREKESKNIIMAVDKNGQLAIRVPVNWGMRRLVELLTASLFGFHTIAVYRYGKFRIYVHPESCDRYVQWDSEPSLIKYTIDEGAKVVVLDIHGVPILGATLQKTTSNNKKAGNKRVDKTSAW